MEASEGRALFPALERVTYLNTAAMNVGSIPAADAYKRAAQEWLDGTFSWPEAEKAGEAARGSFGRLVGAPPDQVALIPAVSASAGLVAAQLPEAQGGENVLVADLEFSSNLFPWMLLREKGYEVRVVPSSGGGVPVSAFAELADERTRLIAVSAVQSASGYRADLRELADVAHGSGGWLFVDACQAAGAVELDARRDGVDLLAAASHKILLGTRGMGYHYVRDEVLGEMSPVGPGWKAGRDPTQSFFGPEMDLSPTASRLDQSLAWFAAVAERESIALFERFGSDATLGRNARLSRRLREKLDQKGVPFADFADPNRSTIVSIPVKDPDAVLARLRKANIVTSLRAGRVRVSLHFYNTAEDIDRFVDVIAQE